MAWLPRTVFVLFAGCATHAEPELLQPASSSIRTHKLGPLDVPELELSDGTAPAGVAWTVGPDHVAVLQGDKLVAKGPGEANVRATWNAQEVEWTLVVDVALMLEFVNPPPTVKVGESKQLKVEARLGSRVMASPKLTWESSAPAVGMVSSKGLFTAKEPGSTFISVDARGSGSMVELTVVP